MADASIKVGDVCHDLIERGKVQIVAKKADTVADLREREKFDLADYKAHPLIRVPDDDTVWTAVYLPDKPTTTFNGSYDFPESRLARVPVEEANQDLMRVQHDSAVQLTRALLSAYNGVEDDTIHRLEVAIEEVLGDDLASLVFELADVENQFGGDDG